MSLHDDPSCVRWRLHLASPPRVVHRFLATDAGRRAFWAAAAPERDGVIHFRFPAGVTLEAPVLENVPPRLFALAYFGGRPVRFELEADDHGGTDLTLVEADVPPADREDHLPGWVSVLMSLKAAVDFSVDLRNHSTERTWERGYIDV
jgi:hypothetical protein